MSSDASWQIDSSGPNDTEQLAEKLARNLKGGELIELVSDLGGGKTTFVRGLAKGLGSPAVVSSPTFKISNFYQGSKLALYHYDLYRLSEPGLIIHELHDVMNDPLAVVVIEWADIVRGVLPAKRLSIILSTRGENERHLQFNYPPQLNYLLKGI